MTPTNQTRLTLRSPRRQTLFLLALAAGIDVAPAAPQTLPPSSGVAPAASSPAPSAQGAAEALRDPRYNLLRWQDDFSYLDGAPESYAEDFFDPLKNIRLSDWRVSLGGSLRGRLELRDNNFPNQADPTHDTTYLQRYYLHADVKYRELLRFYVEGIFAAIEDNDSANSPVSENLGDFYQYFADLRILGEEVPLTLRAGRQELLYGKQRLISPLDWSNTRRRFDGFKLFWQGEQWTADVFYVFPVRSSRSRLDEFDSRQPLLGLYATYLGIPRHAIDLYYFYNRNGNEQTNVEGSRGTLNLSTLGARFWGKTAGWDYDTELSGQFGKFAGDNVQAWSWAADAGYTIDSAPWRPRLGAGFDLASGDSSLDDGQHATFNQLFPLGHAYLGYIDFIGRQNIVAGNVNVTVQPAKNVEARAAYHAFWLAENSDGLYNAGGALVRRDPTGSAPHDVGNELDLTVAWKVDFRTSVLLGYSHFWNGGFVNSTGRGDDGDFVYLQFEVKF